MTFRKDVLQHLGIKPGDKIELELLPDGRGLLKAPRQAGTIATLEEINAANTGGGPDYRPRPVSPPVVRNP